MKNIYEETQKAIKYSENNTLKDFQTIVIESVQEMITNQIDKSNKHMMAGVQKMISEQAEASKKYMMEAIQIVMKVSIITQQQINTLYILPSNNTTLQNQTNSSNPSNIVNNENQQSYSNNTIPARNAIQNEDENSTHLIWETSTQAFSDIQLNNTRNSANNDEELQWEDMYDIDEEFDNDNIEILEV